MGFQTKPQSMGSSTDKLPRTKRSRRGYGCRSGTLFGSFSWIIFQNLEFSLWPQAVSSGSLAGFQRGGRLPPCPMEPFGFLIYVHHSEWSKPKALLIKDESEVTFENATMMHINITGKAFMATDDTIKICLHFKNSRGFVHLHSSRVPCFVGEALMGKMRSLPTPILF